MKELDKATAREQSKTDVSNMPDRVFKILTGLEKRVEDISESLNTDRKKEPITDEECNK